MDGKTASRDKSKKKSLIAAASSKIVNPKGKNKNPDVILGLVFLATYFVETQLSFISLYLIETVNIPHIHLGIYTSKLSCYRSIFIILGCLTEYGIYKICDIVGLEKKHPGYREFLSVLYLFLLCFVRATLVLALYFSDQILLHLYIAFNAEAFYFGLFQTSLISLSLDHSGELKAVYYFVSMTTQLTQFVSCKAGIDHRLMVKGQLWCCLLLSVMSLIIWPIYLYRYHKPSKQYDQYIFFVKTMINGLISFLDEIKEKIDNVNKKLGEMDKLKSDATDEIDEKNSQTAEDQDTKTENGLDTSGSGGTDEDGKITSENDETKQDSGTGNDSINTENGKINEKHKLKNEIITVLNSMDCDKISSDMAKTKKKIDEMMSDPNKHKEMFDLLNKEINSLMTLSDDIKKLKSEIDNLKDKLHDEIEKIKEQLTELEKKISKLLSDTNKLDGEIKKIVHNNFLWVLSPFLMIIPITLIYHFLFDGIIPHALLDDDASKDIVITATTARFFGTLPAFCMTANYLPYRFWTWQQSLFWIALFPEIIVLVFAILAIQSELYFFKSFVGSTMKIGALGIVLAISHGLMESTSFVSVSNHVHFHSADPDDFYLVLIHIILETYLKFIALKLSASYNEARISLGYHYPMFYPVLDVQPLEGFKLTLVETVRRFFLDIVFDIRVNINQFI